MTALFPSVLRTAVPLIAGWILTRTGALGIELDTATVAYGVTAGVTLAYYVLFRLVELGAARLGWDPLRLAAGLLLGWARPPEYPGKPSPTTLAFQLDPVEPDELKRAVRRNVDGRE